MTKQIFWLRETAKGGWVTPFAYTGELPLYLKDHIEIIPAAEIHLPYLERSQSLYEKQPLALHYDKSGAAILSPEEEGAEYVTRYQVALALAAAVHGVEDGGFHLTAGDGVALDGMESIGWHKPPIERKHGFFRAWDAVSRAFQPCLRERFPAAYFADIERFRDTKAAAPVLLFAASSPFLTRTRSVFTYDLLDHESVEKFYRSAERGLPAVLAATEARLINAGMADLASFYAPSKAHRILDLVRRDRNPMRSVIFSESMLFDEFFRLAHAMYDFGASRRPLKTAPKVADEFVRHLHTRLRRFYNSVPMQQLAMPLFLAVTHALYESRSPVK